MIEFGLPLRGQQQSNCMNAVYSYFSSRWGNYTPKGFDRIPQLLQSLKPILIRKNKFIGGIYDLELKANWNVDCTEEWTIQLQHRLGGKTKFSTKTKSTIANNLIVKLNSNKKLISTLDQVDLVGVTINLAKNTLNLSVTPMGGGICYMVIPPVRYIVPLAGEQRSKLAWCIESLASEVSVLN